MKILWVEDKIDEVIAIFEALCFRGHTITVANSRDEAEQELNAGWKGELVILDSFMPNRNGRPGHTGLDILAGLRAGRWGKWGGDVQVVFITGFMQDVQSALNASGTPAGIIVKPVTLDNALRRLEEAIPNITVTVRDNAKAVFAIGSGNSHFHDASENFHVPLSPHMLGEIKKLATAWLNDNNEHSIEASRRLLSILTSARSEQEQRAELDEFRAWVTKLEMDVREALKTGAAVVGIAAPLLHGLGLLP